MASNTRIPKAELTGIYGAMVKRMSRKMLGDVPEPVEVAWHNRKVLNFSFSLARKMEKWDQCDESLKSFAHMAVACQVGCSFCLDLGYFMAHRENLDEAKAYLSHPVLGPRLVECTKLVVDVKGRTIGQIFASPDDLKFRSSMTLFAHATTDNKVFLEAIQKYFKSGYDDTTLMLM